MSNLEARARALAHYTLKNGVGNPEWHKRHLAAGVPPQHMPRLLTDEEIAVEVERDWHLYAKIITGEIQEEMERDMREELEKVIADDLQDNEYKAAREDIRETLSYSASRRLIKVLEAAGYRIVET